MPNQTKPSNRQIEDISAPQTRINLLIAVLQPCFQTDSFEYKHVEFKTTNVLVHLIFGRLSFTLADFRIQNQRLTLYSSTYGHIVRENTVEHQRIPVFYQGPRHKTPLEIASVSKSVSQV